MWFLLQSLKAVVRFRDYAPQPVGIKNTLRWIKQFERDDRRLVCKLLDKVIYFSEKDTKAILLHQNRKLIEDLTTAGLPTKKLIYLQTDDAGSSNGDDESGSEEECSPDTLADRLTWWNLGYRLGSLFKETSPPLVEEMYQWSTKQYRESKVNHPG